jgi:hypothetical protein
MRTIVSKLFKQSCFKQFQTIKQCLNNQTIIFQEDYELFSDDSKTALLLWQSEVRYSLLLYSVLCFLREKK